MHAAVAAAGFALGASAAILPRDQCCFSLTASGGQSGTLSQLSDGQNRIGASGSTASYCINNGAITDSSGRGCILTSPTTQFQCDAGATASSGFSVTSGGDLDYNGSGTFYACPATDSGEYNIYTQPVDGQSNRFFCGKLWCGKLWCGELCSGKLCPGSLCSKLCPGSLCSIICAGSLCGIICTGSLCGIICAGSLCGIICTSNLCSGNLCSGSICGIICSGNLCSGNLCSGSICGILCSGSICGILCSGKHTCVLGSRLDVIRMQPSDWLIDLDQPDYRASYLSGGLIRASYLSGGLISLCMQSGVSCISTAGSLTPVSPTTAPATTAAASTPAASTVPQNTSAAGVASTPNASGSVATNCAACPSCAAPVTVTETEVSSQVITSTLEAQTVTSTLEARTITSTLEAQTITSINTSVQEASTIMVTSVQEASTITVTSAQEASTITILSTEPASTGFVTLTTESDQYITVTTAIPTTVPASTAPAVAASVPSSAASVPASAASGQASSAPASSAPASSAPASAASVPGSTAPATGTNSAASGSACQTDLSGAYQTPSTIVPVSSDSPDTAYGTSYSGEVNSTMSTIFNFDIPQSYAGKHCSLVFLLPAKADLQTSNYTFSGSGSIDFACLNSAASQETTWNSAPGVKQQLGSIAVQPGNSYVVSSGTCPAGTTKSIEMSSSGDLGLSFFEDYNPSPVGLYITSC
ncbi:hypothetical protein LTR08_004178 [Meristemomyces frigidus]|nr:hypothetical protein LTR08_004178 [Meristemomyces frigidus]